MEPEHSSKTSSELKTHPATSPFEVKPGKKLTSSSSYSSSSGSSSQDFVDLDTDEIGDTRTSATTSHKPTQVGSSTDDEEIPVSTLSRPEQNSGELSTNNGSATQSPPTQVMERADEFDDCDPNRIPAHVFDRSKSSAPVEWSVCSNESLFSIHMGNMSFTRDTVNWMGKSGELGYIGTDYPSSMPPIDFSSNQPPSCQTAELNMKKSGNLNQGLGATEAVAAETMREVIRENAASDQLHTPVPPQKLQPRPSNNSDDSIKSFAFPILTGDVDHNESVSVGKEKRKKQPASQPQTPKTTPQQQTESAPQTPKPQTPKEGQSGGQVKWLTCFPCCPFCS